MVTKMETMKTAINYVFLNYSFSDNRNLISLFSCKGYRYLINMSKNSRGAHACFQDIVGHSDPAPGLY